MAGEKELKQYHSEEYIDFIRDFYEEKDGSLVNRNYSIGISSDTPAFPNIYEFCRLTTGASLLAADVLIQNKSDVVCNWMGGYHHAKKSKASGFCYTNDIVISILRLLEFYDKVMYVDIDVHHGDGVEEAFYNSNRVLTLSFHQFDEEEHFFPGTGDFDEVGVNEGIYHAVNVPLKPGCDDQTFTYLFDKIFEKTVQVYRPNVIWLQCGADSLIGDVLGRFRLSTKAHGAAVKKVLNAGIPVILGGGGGYTIENVARCWAYETSLAVGIDIPDRLPETLQFYEYYKNDPYLHVYDSTLMGSQSNTEVAYWKFNKDPSKQYAIYSDKSYAETTLANVMMHLKRLEGVCCNNTTKGNSFVIRNDLKKNFKN